MSTRRPPPRGDAAIPHAVSATRHRLEIKVPKGRDLSRADRFIEAACTRAGLRVRLKRLAATYPGSVHWHFRKGHETGTLEITLWRRGGRIWLSVHPRRAAPWIADAVQRLRAAFERRFGK